MELATTSFHLQEWCWNVGSIPHQLFSFAERLMLVLGFNPSITFGDVGIEVQSLWPVHEPSAHSLGRPKRLAQLFSTLEGWPLSCSQLNCPAHISLRLIFAGHSVVSNWSANLLGRKGDRARRAQGVWSFVSWQASLLTTPFALLALRRNYFFKGGGILRWIPWSFEAWQAKLLTGIHLRRCWSGGWSGSGEPWSFGLRPHWLSLTIHHSKSSSLLTGRSACWPFDRGL